MRGTSPDGAYWWLHAKPLDAAIERMLAPYWPVGHHGHHHHCHVKTQSTEVILASNYCTFLLTNRVTL